MEVDDERLVLGPDGPDEEVDAVAAVPGPRVLERVGPDGGPRQVGVGDVPRVEDDPRVERQQALG